MRSTIPLLLVLATAAPAAAQRPGGDSGWAEIFDRDRREARRRVREGLALMVRSMSGLDARLGDEPEWLLLERALLRFERARRHLPDDPELAYYTAYALTEWERPSGQGGTEMRSDEAVDAWHRLRRIAPDFQPDRVAYHLAMLHMRRHEFELARAEYAASLDRATPAPVNLFYRFYVPSPPEAALGLLYAPIDRANLHGNYAEVLMLTGDVRGAETHYRRALAETEDMFTRSLAQWGLALALERSGDHDGALEWADRALRESPLTPDDPRYSHLVRRHGGFAVLHLDFVFFEPAYEIHAYEALGHEARATRDVEPVPVAIEDALRSWRLFLAEGGVGSRFAALARDRVRDLEARVAALPPRARPRPTEREPDLFRF